MSLAYLVFLVPFLIFCTVISAMVLIQENKSSGLGMIMGGDSSSSVFGTSTAEVLTKLTAWCGLIFVVACLILSAWTNASNKMNQPSVFAINEETHR